MALSPADQLRVETIDTDAGVFDNFTTFGLRNTILAPSEASFEAGDDRTFNSLIELTNLGANFRVTLNSRPRLTGRVEARDSPQDASRGSVLRFVVRTRLNDAAVASADPRIRVKDTTLRDFILALYDTIGVGEDQFEFRADLGRELITGKASRGGRTPLDIAPLKQDQAKVRPPETVFQAADRHLRRFGFMHWDSPDGKIIVGQPDDTQDPIYRFVVRSSSDQFHNNCLSIRRTEDVGQAATLMGVYGTGGGRVFSKAKVSAVEVNQQLLDAGFNRAVLAVDEGIKTKEFAERRVRREAANRNRTLNRMTVVTDELSYRDGEQRINFGPDTVADLDSELLGGALGAYYVEGVDMTRDPSAGDQTQISCVVKGIWVL